MNKSQMRSAVICGLACLVAAAAAGCGQRGPLYLPDDPSEMQPVIPETGPDSGEGSGEDDEAEG